MTDNVKIENPLVYAIVLNWNGYEDTKRCVESLINVSYQNLNIVIVDNCSTDGSPDLIRSVYPGMDFLQSDINGGYASGMNLGAKYAVEKKADYILLLNNDTVFEKDFLKEMLSVFESDNKIGIISPKVLYMDNPEEIYCAGGKYRGWACVGKNRYQHRNRTKYGIISEEISFAEGCCLIIKREVFEKIGFISEEYFMYFEDLDFSARARNKFKIWYESKSIIYHKAGAGKAIGDYTPLYSFYFTRNRLLFYRHSNLLAKIYAVIFSLAIVILKDLFIVFRSLFNKKNRVNRKKAFIATWHGFFTGISLVFGPERKVDNSIKY
jgi:GT2 family glycosyltransferase